MKLTEKLTKCGDSLTVNMYDNGFMVEVSGRDNKDDWKTTKIMCPTLDDVVQVIKDASEMPRD